MVAVSDLDKAIRDRLAVVRTNMTAHYAVQDDGRVDAVWNDAGELAMAVQQLLDWANDLETDFEGAESVVGRAFANQIRRIIATSLDLSPVSSQDTPPAPRTAREPRQFWNSDPEPEDVDKVRDDALGYVWARNDRNGLWYSDGAAPRPWGSLPTEITEVLSESVSTDTDGADR